MRVHRNGRRLGCAALLVVFATMGALCLASPRAARAARLGGNAPPLFDRTFKCDLLERLSEPPQLVIFGGSRAQRFEPSVVQRLTGLPAFNFAVQNSRPEDVYAMARYLFWRSPSVKLRCFWALQATTLSDSPLHPGLLAESRLSQFLPDYLVDDQQGAITDTSGREMQGSFEYGARGNLLRNGYDRKEQRGISFDATLSMYLAQMVPRAGTPSPYTQTRAREYFERTLRLFNLHGVAPVLVIMPYHPKALAAFRAVGWQAKADAFKAYLESLRGTYAFSLLDYTELASFGGTPAGFYDGAHIKSVNARRILEQAVADAPAGFR
jgi:hypothetical protein